MEAMETSEAQRNITRNVRILMAARDMYEQRELADALGWPSAKMTKTLKGDRRWSVEDLYEVAQVFGIAASVLLGTTADVVGAAGPTVAAPVNGSVTSRYSLPEQRHVVREAQVIDLASRRQGVILLDAPDGSTMRHVG